MMNFSRKRLSTLALTAAASLLLLQACSSSDNTNAWKTPAQTGAPTAAPAPVTPAAPALNGQWTGTPPLTVNQTPVMPAPRAAAKVKIALLVPLSGSSAEVGESISNAAQMALFDSGADNFELVPRDTHGTATGAAAAAQSAIQDGAQMILGPLFAEEVRAVSPLAQNANINAIAFTTDWKQAGPNTYVMGFVPFGQVQRVISYAAAKGIRNIGVIAPQNDYGNAVMNAYTSQAGLSGIETADVLRTRPGDASVSAAVQKFSQNKASMQAVFMPIGGTDGQTIGNLLSYNNLDATKVRRLGTGLWDDAAIARETNLAGGWFAAPDPAARKNFEQKYQDIYGKASSRLASLGYDATALAAVLAKTGQARNGAPAFDRASITNANGFSGIDGIFRFRPDGLAERGLAILELRNGQAVVIDPAPRSFQPSP